MCELDLESLASDHLAVRPAAGQKQGGPDEEEQDRDGEEYSADEGFHVRLGFRAFR